MVGLERFNETLLPTKKEFHSNLTTRGITDTDYKHSKIIWDNVVLQNLNQYHRLHVQFDTLLLVSILKVSETNALKLVTGKFKETKVEVVLLKNIDMLLMVDTNITSRKCHAINGNTKAKKKDKRDYDLSTQLSYLMSWNVKNLC